MNESGKPRTTEPIRTELMVLGAGPGGYAAAFYAADQGMQVTLVDEEKRLGGVCLNHGCIPSKALLHATRLIKDARASAIRGIEFGTPAVKLDAMRAWKESILERLAEGISYLAQKRNVQVIKGRGRFADSNTLNVESDQGERVIHYNHGIVAVGSKPLLPAGFDMNNKNILTSTDALELKVIPKTLLVVGGGYIGLELGGIYAALGSHVVLAEALDSILPGMDADLARYVMRSVEKMFREVRLSTKVLNVCADGAQAKVTMERNKGVTEERYDKVLVAVGRIANCDDVGLENTKIEKDKQGFVKVDVNRRTSDPSLYAIGDVVGSPLLAHKASMEAHIAIDALNGKSEGARASVIPAVVFTDPELAWCGLTQTEAAERNIESSVVRFPWSASGRALAMDRTDGLTKLIIDPKSERILGAGIVGAGAGELISEVVLAIEMGATAKDLARSIHPHPTLSETLMESARIYCGNATHALSRAKS